MPVPTTPANLDTTRRLLHDDVFERILAKISDGSFAPGDKLDDAALAEWLAVSRFPIRQALSRLAALGVVDMAANRYTRVAQPDPEMFLSGIEILVSLWKLGARTAVEGLTDDDLDDFDERVDTVVALLTPFDPASIWVGVAALGRVLQFFLDHSGNTLLPETASRVQEQVAHVLRSGSAYVDAGALTRLLEGLRSAVRARDITAVSAGLEQVHEVATSFHDRMTTVAS